MIIIWGPLGRKTRRPDGCPDSSGFHSTFCFVFLALAFTTQAGSREVVAARRTFWGLEVMLSLWLESSKFSEVSKNGMEKENTAGGIFRFPFSIHFYVFLLLRNCLKRPVLTQLMFRLIFSTFQGWRLSFSVQSIVILEILIVYLLPFSYDWNKIKIISYFYTLFLFYIVNNILLDCTETFQSPPCRLLSDL